MTTATHAVEPMTVGDWEAVAAIYQQGIDTGLATFETSPPRSWEDWQAGKINECSLVARCGKRVVGWAALSPVARRRCYAGVAEVSIYVSADERGRGVGSLLLAALTATAEAHGIWTLQASMFPENMASLRLHARHGFRLVGRRDRIARMEIGERKGTWCDTLLLERRSAVVGT